MGSARTAQPAADDQAGGLGPVQFAQRGRHRGPGAAGEVSDAAFGGGLGEDVGEDPALDVGAGDGCQQRHRYFIIRSVLFG